MPELPEVETTLRGIRPFLEASPIEHIEIRENRLRWPISDEVATHALGKPGHLMRRGKYIIMGFDKGELLIHLGMSGSMRISQKQEALRKHDHVIFHLQDGRQIRFHDPRRFGSVLWALAADKHPLIAHLGPEPLSDSFYGSYLYEKSRRRKTAVKQFIMDSRTVVGVGNIYANEALFLAGISPIRQAKNVSAQRYEKLSAAIKMVLSTAIEVGGTTLRDFVSGDNEPGYFQQTLKTYGRGNQSCVQCQNTLSEIRLSGRSTVYCKQCQR